jgi:4-azaleucine resistance transporter AzlC
MAGAMEGVRLASPLIPGSCVFAAAFGAAAAEKGLTLTEATLMSTFVFAGLSQFVSLEVWASDWTLPAILTIALVCGTVNLRLVLASASLRPWMGRLPSWQSYGALSTLTDANWLIATGYHAKGGRDVGVFVGAGLVLWVFWIVFTVPGYLLHGLIPDPKAWGIDMVMPAFFVAMLVPQWKSHVQTRAWLVAGAVSLATAWLLPGFWFIIAGALAGALVGGLLDDRE